jgi:predicted HTH domain antitoxin
MPPIQNKKTSNTLEREGRLELAIKAFQNKEIASIREAARLFEIPYATLRHRLNGRPARVNLRANLHKLSSAEENLLVQWILDLAKRGLPPRPAFVENMANHLLNLRNSTSTPPRVGKNWVTNLIKRRTELQSRYSRRYNHDRAKCEDIRIIKDWFKILENTITEHGILSEDIYNFDETGFAMGLCATTKVITSSERYGRAKLLQPGNREWVTVIEAVNASGWALPPYVILKGQNLLEGWFDGLPNDWRLDVSSNGWTTDEIGIKWLTRLFVPAANSRRVGNYILLILDGHGSHLTPEFDHICKENKIIPLCMPAHSSHLLQPLDVTVFAVLKRVYGGLVEQRMRLGFNTIQKADFLDAYPAARMEAFKAQNIQSGFRATGIAPFEPDRVIQQLDIQLRTPTPPASRSSNSGSSWILQTPSNPRQLHKQGDKVKNIMEQRLGSPPRGLVEGLDQIIKACEYGMVNATIMKKQYQDIFAANEKEKQKRKRSRRRIQQEGGLTREEAVQPAIPAAEPVEQPVVQPPPPPPAELRPRVRAPQRCSNCGTLGHTRLRCPEPSVI